jgi:SAM-dependent methyltransferase
MRCVCCHHQDFLYQYKLRDLSFGEEGEWDFVCCSHCGHGCLSPIPTNEELIQLYTDLYSQEKKEQMIKMGKGDFDQGLQRRRARMLGSVLEGKDIHSIVDVGCGMGFSLGKLTQKWPHAQSIGLEMSPIAAEEAKKIDGVEIHHLSFQQAVHEQLWEREQVDIITMNHVVEHLIDPRIDLQLAYDQLRIEGVMLIEIPHLDGWGRRWMKKWWWGHLPPQHIHMFSLCGIESLLKEIGFSIVARERHGYPLIFLFTWVLFLRGTIGGLSSFRSNRIMKIIAIVIGVVFSPIVIVLDLLLTTFMNMKHGDLITIVVRKDN